jgi:hypothetical protein
MLGVDNVKKPLGILENVVLKNRRMPENCVWLLCGETWFLATKKVRIMGLEPSGQ